MLDTLADGRPARRREGITLAFETGQETADLLRPDAGRAEVAQPQGQFRPGQHAALRHGRPDPRRRDPRPGHPLGPRQGRPAPESRRASGARKSPLGEGEVDINRFVRALKTIGYTGPLIVEREVGDQAGRLRDVALGLGVLRGCVSG